MEYLVRPARGGAAFALPSIKRLSKNRYLRHERQLPSAPDGARPARRGAPVSYITLIMFSMSSESLSRVAIPIIADVITSPLEHQNRDGPSRHRDSAGRRYPLQIETSIRDH